MELSSGSVLYLSPYIFCILSNILVLIGGHRCLDLCCPVFGLREAMSGWSGSLLWNDLRRREVKWLARRRRERPRGNHELLVGGLYRRLYDFAGKGELGSLCFCAACENSTRKGWERLTCNIMNEELYSFLNRALALIQEICEVNRGYPWLFEQSIGMPS